MTKLSEDIIGRIKHDRIVPAARWHFLLRRRVFLGLLAISVLLGSLSFSVIVHIIDFGDLDISNKIHGGFLTSTMMLLPYLWLLSVVLFSAVAYYNWKHTKLGYRFRRRWIVMTSVAVSVILGSVLYALGMGNKVDNLVAESMPFYDQSRRQARVELWMRPENGLLVGKVMNIDAIDNTITIKDESGQDWKIDEKDLQRQTDKVIAKKGKIVKIVGRKESENVFAAKEIRRCGDCEHDEDVEAKENDGNKEDNISKVNEEIGRINGNKRGESSD